MNKKTVVMGASPNPNRYAYTAAYRLRQNGHTVVPVGMKQGEVADELILNLRDRPAINDVDTVTMYMGLQHQQEWEDYILDLAPKRVVFNPGTENPDFYQRLAAADIEAVEACTLVMLSVGNY